MSSPKAAIKLHDFSSLNWELARGYISEDLDGLHENLRALQNAVFDTVASTSAVQNYTTTGTEHNFKIATDTDVIVVSNAAATFTGFDNPTAGRELTILYTGSGTCKVVHQSTSSFPTYRIFCASTNGLTVGQYGAIRLIYDSVLSQWRAFTLSAGKPITPTFAAGDYTAATGNWTLASGDVTKFTYTQVNKQLTLDFELITTTVSATPTTLNRVLPASFTCTKGSYNAMIANNNGTKAIGIVWVDPATDLLKFYATGAFGAWATATDATGVAGQITIEVD